MATQQALLAGRYKPLSARISGGAQAIVRQLLVVDPQQRASLEVSAGCILAYWLIAGIQSAARAPV